MHVAQAAHPRGGSNPANDYICRLSRGATYSRIDCKVCSLHSSARRRSSVLSSYDDCSCIVSGQVVLRTSLGGLALR
jgi:hypothetical protein